MIKGDKLNKLILEVGEKYVELIVNEDTLRELDLIYANHMKINTNRKMSNKEYKRIHLTDIIFHYLL